MRGFSGIFVQKIFTLGLIIKYLQSNFSIFILFNNQMKLLPFASSLDESKIYSINKEDFVRIKYLLIFNIT